MVWVAGMPRVMDECPPGVTGLCDGHLTDIFLALSRLAHIRHGSRGVRFPGRSFLARDHEMRNLAFGGVASHRRDVLADHCADSLVLGGSGVLLKARGSQAGDHLVNGHRRRTRLLLFLDGIVGCEVDIQERTRQTPSCDGTVRDRASKGWNG